MKAVSKRRIIAFLAMIMLVVSSIGLTTAYFSDRDQAEGYATLNLRGESKIDEGDKEFKEIVITNTGKADLIVRVKLFGVDPDKMDVTVPSGWAAGDEGWYYYKKILPGDQSPQATTGDPITVKLKEDLSAADIAELGESFDVTVIHEATPVVYNGSSLDLPDGWTLPAGVPEQ